ncbi:hypothetical protein PMAC_001428 [Pneumocystis sp. 'macacae']|nr:hypothetical protein PMAC_001428 [Pneumocystis sp. 'macacae']
MIIKRLLHIFTLLLSILTVISALELIKSDDFENEYEISEENKQKLLKIGILKEPSDGLTRYTTLIFHSIVSSLSAFTNDVSDIWEWVLENFPSVFSDNPPSVQHVVGEYIKSKMSTFDQWTVFTHAAFPKYQLRVRSFTDMRIDFVKQHAGYIDIEDKHFFFWFFESRSNPSKDPLLIWLNGGPGCSSMYGLLTAIGPSKLDRKTGRPYYNPYSWNQHSSILFLDQPVNVGFSYSDNPVKTSFAASGDFYAFLIMFLSKFPQYSNLDVHLAGESYAGHYIPLFASVISMNQDESDEDLYEIEIKQNESKEALYKTENEQNKEEALYKAKNEQNAVTINLRSIIIGNGLVDPPNQFPYYHYMGCNGSYGRVLPKEVCSKMLTKYPECRRYVKLCTEFQCPCVCKVAYDSCVDILLRPYVDHSIDIYDIRNRCKDDCTSEITKVVENFMNTPSNKQLFNATKNFTGCNMTVYTLFHDTGELMESVVTYIEELLSVGIKVLIFAGDADVICNWYGTHSWVHKLDWEGSSYFNENRYKPWTLARKIGKKPAGTLVGEKKTYNGLTLLRVYNAGHVTPMDQPEASYDMYMRWIHKKYEFN